MELGLFVRLARTTFCTEAQFRRKKYFAIIPIFRYYNGKGLLTGLKVLFCFVYN